MTPADSLPRIGSALQEYDAELTEAPPEIPDEDRYWAARSDPALVQALKAKEDAWFEYAQNHGHLDMWLVMLAEYYGKDPTTFAGFDSVGVGLEGDDEELVRFRVNDLRVYIRQHISATTRERPSFKAGTLNTNYSAGATIEITDAISNYVYERFMGEKREKRLVERGELLAKVYTWCRWDDSGGDNTPVMIPPGTKLPNGMTASEPIPVPGAFEKTGAPMLRIKCPWDVIEDPTVDDEDDHAWRLARERRGKWELMAAYPDHRNEIKGVSITSETAYELSVAFDDSLATDEDVMVKHFYHPPSRELPEGLYAVIVGETVLERLPWAEAPIAGDGMPLKQYEPSEMINSSFGYSESWDLLPIQQMDTQVVSDIATNISAFGRQFIMLPHGSELAPEQLANGMFAAYVPEDQLGKISAPNLAQVGSSSQWFIGHLDKKKQILAGQNSVTMGDPSENIKSGTMAALFHAIALEHGQARQAALDKHREEVCTMIVDFVRKFAKGQFLANIVGEDEAPKLRHFGPEVFEPVRQVFVKTSNPMLRARSGQLELANYLKDVPGAIRTPAQAVQAFTTGQVKPLYRNAEARLALIQWENERLREGPQVARKQVPRMNPMTGMPELDPMTGMPAMDVEESTPDVPVLMTHDPFQHIPEHECVLYDPQTSPEGKAATQAHIAEHMRVYRTVPPDLCAIIGFPPAPSAMPNPAITSPDGGANGKAAKPSADKSKMPDVDKAGADLPAPAKPPQGAAVEA